MNDGQFVDAVLARIGSLGNQPVNDNLDASELRHITLDTPLCWGCKRKCFTRLLYDWRVTLPAAEQREWPTRPDCYYGVNCFTQKRSLQHAAKLNHCCPQTRFQA